MNIPRKTGAFFFSLLAPLGAGARTTLAPPPQEIQLAGACNSEQQGKKILNPVGVSSTLQRQGVARTEARRPAATERKKKTSASKVLVVLGNRRTPRDEHAPKRS